MEVGGGGVMVISKIYFDEFSLSFDNITIWKISISFLDSFSWSGDML